MKKPSERIDELAKSVVKRDHERLKHIMPAGTPPDNPDSALVQVLAIKLYLDERAEEEREAASIWEKTTPATGGKDETESSIP